MLDVIVLGGGPAGVTAALRAGELGASVTLIESRRLGGTCTNDGCVPTRVLAKASRLLRDSEQFSMYGLDGAAPTLDYPKLITRTQQVVYQIHEKKQLLKHLEDSGVNVLNEVGPARFVDPRAVELAGGEKLGADRFILCVGGHPKRLIFEGSEHALTHHDIWSLKTLPKSMVIIGAAATGCQLASIFQSFGSQVYLVDIAEKILPQEDPSISSAMHQAFEERGIRHELGIDGVDKIEKSGDQYLLHFRKDNTPRTLETESIVFAVGWAGSVESLNLPAAEVDTERSYIIVNQYLQTTQTHIYAAGDVTGRMMLVQSGSREGRIAAENAVLGPETSFEHAIVPHGGFTDPEYAGVGLNENQIHGDQALVLTLSYHDLDRAVIDGWTEGHFKLIVSRDNHQILGAHAVGEQAVEIVQIVAAGMAAGITVDQLASVELSYPTFTAIVGLAARKAASQLGITILSPQWRALGRLVGAEWERRD
jgi:pyruvate/2-oxoglutarate dehydrogenase complex dihydrolipoamide dehydrogenase (E3) component